MGRARQILEHQADGNGSGSSPNGVDIWVLLRENYSDYLTEEGAMIAQSTSAGLWAEQSGF
jgi:hypothetical protein